MDQQKIQAITEWPPPKDIDALRSFLGLCNFYQCFVKSYSLIAVLLTELLKKVTVWDWGPKRVEAFNALKMTMSSSPVLALPDLAKPFEVSRPVQGNGKLQRASDGAISISLTEREKETSSI
uniref:Uncharacterized mitochondrial protein AtMg00860-like n=1 Tax=Nicotiana tabacum TaxID=4097 RepID=A0A1S4D2N0_TOBAC|nr:PREDICTED: uncharacterized mitochondrial protein AtMg00860-like [Nicotiana tabacum]